MKDRIDKETAQGVTPCLESGLIAGFVLGLSEQEDEIVDHIGSCEHCRLLVNVVSESIEAID